MELAAFAGDWDLERVIEDRLSGRDGRFSGSARFRPVADGLDYVETGCLRLAGAAPMRASRGYLWRSSAGDRVEVVFRDGRFFHGFASTCRAPRAEHVCPPDRYGVRYEFGAWPVWRVRWEIRGPRKDMILHSLYRPAGQPGRIPASDSGPLSKEADPQWIDRTQ